MQMGQPPKRKYFNQKMYFRKFTALSSEHGARHRAKTMRKLDFNARVMKYMLPSGTIQFAVYIRANKRRLKYERSTRAKEAAARRRSPLR